MDALNVSAGWVASVTVLVGGLIQVYRLAKKIDRAIGKDDLGRSLAHRVNLMEERTARIEHQLWPNGGSSLADKVTRIEMGQSHTNAEIGIIKDLVIKLANGSDQ